MPVATNEVTIGRQFEVAENFELALSHVGGGTDDLFIITGGPIYLQELTGIITTIIASTAGCDAHLEHAPNEAGGNLPLCDDGTPLDIDDYRVDSQLTITGAVAVDMTGTIIGIVAAPSFLTNHMILAPGTVSFIYAGAAISGAITWTIVYRPLGFGISVVTA